MSDCTYLQGLPVSQPVYKIEPYTIVQMWSVSQDTLQGVLLSRYCGYVPVVNSTKLVVDASQSSPFVCLFCNEPL
jgi:hypothetical protein